MHSNGQIQNLTPFTCTDAVLPLAYLQHLKPEEPPCTRKEQDDCACELGREGASIRSNGAADNGAHVQLSLHTFRTLESHRPKQRRKVDCQRALRKVSPGAYPPPKPKRHVSLLPAAVPTTLVQIPSRIEPRRVAAKRVRLCIDQAHVLETDRALGYEHALVQSSALEACGTPKGTVSDQRRVSLTIARM